jgi:hypothetical protein
MYSSRASEDPYHSINRLIHFSFSSVRPFVVRGSEVEVELWAMCSEYFFSSPKVCVESIIYSTPTHMGIESMMRHVHGALFSYPPPSIHPSIL